MATVNKYGVEASSETSFYIFLTEWPVALLLSFDGSNLSLVGSSVLYLEWNLFLYEFFCPEFCYVKNTGLYMQWL